MEPKHLTRTADGGIRPSSATFKAANDEISVDLGSLSTPHDSLSRAPKGRHFAVASLAAGEARSQKQGVVGDPLENNKAHALIVGKQTHGVRRKLAEFARWEIPPSDVQMEPGATTPPATA
jgi:hypothetical protein